MWNRHVRPSPPSFDPSKPHYFSNLVRFPIGTIRLASKFDQISLVWIFNCLHEFWSGLNGYYIKPNLFLISSHQFHLFFFLSLYTINGWLKDWMLVFLLGFLLALETVLSYLVLSEFCFISWRIGWIQRKNSVNFCENYEWHAGYLFGPSGSWNHLTSP